MVGLFIRHDARQQMVKRRAMDRGVTSWNHVDAFQR